MGALVCFCLLVGVLSGLVCLVTGAFRLSGEQVALQDIPRVTVIEQQAELDRTDEQDAEQNESDAEQNESGTEQNHNGENGTSSDAGSKTDESGEAGKTEGKTDAGQTPESEPVTLLFAGDLYLTELLQSKYSQQGISAAASSDLLSLLEEADIFMLNEEFPFGTTGEAMEDKQYTFRVNPSYITALTDLHVDLVTLANNHMLDYGTAPLTETIAALDGAGIAHVGAGENLEAAKAYQTFTVGGRTIAFLGASRVVPVGSWAASRYGAGVFTTYDPTALLEQIRAARAACDYVVVYVHWGIERNTQPEDYERTLARQYIDAGADAVIGAHPHVLQGIEYYQGCPIFYSLGNFIFNNGTYESMLVELTLEGEQTGVRLIPCMSTGNRMSLLGAGERPAFYQKMTDLSYSVTVGADGSVSP